MEQTLESVQPWGGDTGELFFINLKPFFEGKLDLTELLPDSYGNQFRYSTFTDPTLSGILPTMTENKALEYFEASLFTNNIWMGTMPMSGNEYWWEPQWWRSHWFGTFYREANDGAFEFDNRIFPSNWMYHMWLGWIYPAVATPESIWIWQENSESWVWTNKEIFPILYSHSSGIWFYVSQEDGSQYIWLNGEWVFFK